MVNSRIDSNHPVPRVVIDLLSPYEPISEINTKGYNSDAIIMGRRIVIKVVGKKRKISSETITPNQLGSLIYKFYSKLQNISSDIVPDFCEWTLVPARSDDPSDLLLLLLSPYMGIDIEEAIIKRDITPINATQLILDFLKLSFNTEGKDGRCLFGIDPKPENFCLNRENSKAIFIDLVPPRFRDEKGKFWLELIDVKNPDAINYGVWKYYTINGMVANLLSRLSRITPENWELYSKEIITWLKNRDYQADWLLDQNSKLDDPNYIEKINNPLSLRLAGCKIAYKIPEFKPRLNTFFSSFTHYEDGDLDPLLKGAKDYLLNFISRSKLKSDFITIKEKEQEISKEVLDVERTIAFITTKNKISLEEYQVVGRFVTKDSTLKIRIQYLQNDLSIRISTAPFDKPLNILLCSPSGAGKTFLVKELCNQFSNCVFSYCKLSDFDKIDKAFEYHITEINSSLEKHPEKVVIACLDEVDTKIAGEFIYPKLIGPMSGDKSQSDKFRDIELKNLIWFFLMSKFETPEQFEIDAKKMEKAIDFLTRIPKTYRISIPNSLIDPEEKIIRATAILKDEFPNIKQVDALFLAYFGVKKFSSTREMELLLRNTISNLPKGALLVKFSDLNIDEDEKNEISSDLSGKHPNLTKSVIELK